MTLLELQRRMSEDVRRPLTDDFDMQQTTEDGTSLDRIADSYIKPNDRLSSFERLEIYNRQYWFRVIEAVSEDFPALNALLGEKKFDALVLAYLRENPSTSWTLRDIGKKLPTWLREHPEFTGRRHQLSLDVTALEWAYVEAFDSLRHPPLTAEDLHAIGPDTRLTLQPHLQLLQLRYPVDELVLIVRRDAPETEVASNASMQRKEVKRMRLPAMKREAVYLAVHRYDDIVYYRRIEREASAILTALRDGETLGEALSKAFHRSRLTPGQQAAKIQETFAHAAELGWFCKPEPAA
ncbi:DUF2063 domain-containing protein [Granulicella sp. 5B5]|uniref:HvfC/BufC N-terminal domain-containing protein n=1 Tax=Granulicella sp. 5B5 TaxID=1617967 RepID=UPI0015F3E442|nr:DNA-binding domain-containing protein [Granulicella sp. 5B5]QMV18890.1 DUF2063 domain-containing protein [Granulicella sp. 5B5]